MDNGDSIGAALAAETLATVRRAVEAERENAALRVRVRRLRAALAGFERIGTELEMVRAALRGAGRDVVR